MATLPVGIEAVLNGTTNVTVLAAPGAATQRTLAKEGITVHNKDTAGLTLIFEKLKGASAYEIDTVTLDPDETYTNPGQQCLDATDESLRMRLSGAPATTNPDVTGAALETT